MTDLEAGSQPDLGPANQDAAEPDVRDYLRSVGVKPDKVEECAAALEAWKAGDPSMIAAKSTEPPEEEPTEEEPLNFDGLSLVDSARKAGERAMKGKGY